MRGDICFEALRVRAMEAVFICACTCVWFITLTEEVTTLMDAESQGPSTSRKSLKGEFRAFYSLCIQSSSFISNFSVTES